MFNRYYTPNAASSKFDLFNHLNKSLKILKRERHSFHDMISKEKSFIYNMFEKNLYFKGVLPRVFHGSKGLKFRNSFSKNAIRNVNYLKNVTDKLSGSNLDQSDISKHETQTVSKQNKLNEINLMKRKRKQLENKLKLHPKPLLKKNNSFIIKPFKIKDFLEKTEEKKNSENQSLDFKIHKLKIKPFKLNKIDFKPHTNISNGKKLKNLNTLLKKCKLGISLGSNMEKSFEKLYFNVYEENEKINKEKNEINMINILNGRKKKNVEVFDFNEKYKEVEESKFKELKNEIKIKVSESFAYANRKEFMKKIHNPRASQAYEFYFQELSSVHQKNLEKMKIEKENISKVENLLEDFHVEKELLKKKINKYNDRHKRERKLSEERESNSKKVSISRDIDEFKKMRNHFKKKLKNMTSINNSII